MIRPLLSGTPALFQVTATHGVTTGGLLLVAIYLLVQVSLVWVLDTLYLRDQHYPVLEKRLSGFELALWEILFAMLARSEATSMTRVTFARVRVLRLFSILGISAASRDPYMAALVTASDMLFR